MSHASLHDKPYLCPSSMYKYLYNADTLIWMLELVWTQLDHINIINTLSFFIFISLEKLDRTLNFDCRMPPPPLPQKNGQSHYYTPVCIAMQQRHNTAQILGLARCSTS